MARKPMYPEGSTTMHLVVPSTVRSGITRLAQQQRQSTSQLVTVILEDWLLRRGELREAEEAIV